MIIENSFFVCAYTLEIMNYFESEITRRKVLMRNKRYNSSCDEKFHYYLRKKKKKNKKKRKGNNFPYVYFTFTLTGDKLLTCNDNN